MNSGNLKLNDRIILDVYLGMKIETLQLQIFMFALPQLLLYLPHCSTHVQHHILLIMFCSSGSDDSQLSDMVLCLPVLQQSQRGIIINRSTNTSTLHTTAIPVIIKLLLYRAAVLSALTSVSIEHISTNCRVASLGNTLRASNSILPRTGIIGAIPEDLNEFMIKVTQQRL